MNVQAWMKGFYLILISIFLLTGHAFSAVAPSTIAPLYEAASQVDTGSIAVAPDGTVYAVQALPAGKGTIIRRFDRSFRNGQDFLVVNAKHITVNQYHELYVADTASKTVTRYDKDKNRMGNSLATGFVTVPKHISIDAASGNVVITLSGTSFQQQKVVVYNRELTAPALTISGLDADLGAPGNPSVRALASVMFQGNYYILASYTVNSSTTSAYLLKYTGTGVFAGKSGVSFYGNGANQLGFGKDMVVDASGRLYVTDAGNMRVLILDTDTLSPLQTFDYNQAPILIATGISSAPGGKMLVSSQPSGNAKVLMYGIDNYAMMTVTPTGISFTSSGLSSQTVTLQNSGNAGLTYTAAASAGWITLAPNPVSGSLAGGGSANFSVGFNAAGLAPGAYTGFVQVTNSLGETEKIVIGLTIENAVAPITLSIVSAPASAIAKPAATTAPSAKNIVVAQGKSVAGPSLIRIFNASQQMVKEFAPFGVGYAGGISVATGDVDGDGYDEIIAAYNGSAANQARIAIFDRAGNTLPNADFLAFAPTMTNGAIVAAGDVDGDGKAEIIVGSGPGSANDSQVRIFAYRNGTVIDTGVNLLAFTTKYGVNVAAGDVDADGVAELIVAPGPDQSAPASVRIFKIDTVADCGSWSAAEAGSFASAIGTGYGANVSAGDLNADGKDEVVLSSISGENRFAAYSADGVSLNSAVVAAGQGGLATAVGDMNGDGIAEVIAVPTGQTSNTMVTIYQYGVSMGTFEAFTNSLLGARVSLGKLGY